MISPPPRRANPCELFRKRYLDFGKRILIGASTDVATVTIWVVVQSSTITNMSSETGKG
jgi:hypothetical protein